MRTCWEHGPQNQLSTAQRRLKVTITKLVWLWPRFSYVMVVYLGVFVVFLTVWVGVSLTFFSTLWTLFFLLVCLVQRWHDGFFLVLFHLVMLYLVDIPRRSAVLWSKTEEEWVDMGSWRWRQTMKSGGCGNCDQNVTYERKIKKNYLH